MITIKNLSKSFGEKNIFKNLTLQFPSKGIVCIYGSSGSGKTTLMNMIAGFDNDYDGEIIIKDKNIKNFTSQEFVDYRSHIATNIFQEYSLLKGYTTLENIMLATKDLTDSQQKNTAMSLLEQIGLKGKENRKINNLSGGEKQRVAIARALISNPSILIADEPTGALDSKNTHDIMQILCEIAQTRLVLVITHDEDLKKYANSLLMLSTKGVKYIQNPCEEQDTSKSKKYSDKKKPYYEQKITGKQEKVEKQNNEELQDDKIIQDNELSQSNETTQAKEIQGQELNFSSEEKQNYEATQTLGQTKVEQSTLIKKLPRKAKVGKLARKNIAINFGNIALVFFIIAFSIASLITALNISSTNERDINKFTSQNPAYNNVFIRLNKDKDPTKLYEELLADTRVENVYYKYDILGTTVELDDKKVEIARKKAMPTSDRVAVHGRLPLSNSNDVSISPSLAKKLSDKSLDLLGKTIKISYTSNTGESKTLNLTVSGIHSYEFDDYILSASVEQQLFANINKDTAIGLTFDIKNFDQVVNVVTDYEKNNALLTSAKEEIIALYETFRVYKMIFIIISSVILAIGTAATILLLSKLATSRKKEIALLSSLGYTKKDITKMFLTENAIMMIGIILSVGLMLLLFSLGHLLIFSAALSMPIWNAIVGIIGGILLVIITNVLVFRKILCNDIIKNFR